MWILSSASTIKVNKKESGVEIQKENNRSEFGVVFEHGHGRDIKLQLVKISLDFGKCRLPKGLFPRIPLWRWESQIFTKYF